jgi:hypothetical protein
VVAVVDDKREALAALCRKYGVVRLFVFGSALRDDFRPGKSDIDLLVETSVDAPSGAAAHLPARRSPPQRRQYAAGAGVASGRHLPGRATMTRVTFKTSTVVGWIVIAVTIVVCAVIAIVVHAVLPEKVDEALLDGVLVLQFGFPAVAVAYFLILFAQCSVSVVVSSPTAQTRPLRHGLTLGLAFAVMYMIGMQEIMVDTSPFAAWGSDFVAYQAIIGLGDAIPVILLCAVTGALLADGRTLVAFGSRRSLVGMLVMTLTVGTVRWLVSALGIIQSGLAEYPIAVVGWGYLLGLGFGIGYLLLTRTNTAAKAVMLYGVGLNWLIFNSFIGLVFDGTIGDALLRSAIDVAAVGLSMALMARLVPSSAPVADAGERAGQH